MSDKTIAEVLREAVNETSNASVTINPTAEGWAAYFSSQKKKIENKDLDIVHRDATDFIIKNRVSKESKSTSNKPGANKNYRLP